VPGVTTGAQWLVIDRATWAAVGGTPPVDRLLVRLDPRADPDTVAAAITTATDATLLVTTRAKAVGQIADSVLVRGVRAGMLAVAAAGLVLVAVVLGLMLVAEAPSRGRTAALLATVGAPGRVHRRLVVSEVLGPVLVGGAAGVLAGAVLPWVVLRLVDLRPFTGAYEQPPIAVDPVLLAGAAGGLVLVVALGVAFAVATARRGSPVAVLREGAGG
jgi:putative ABC transport system permease protein